MGSKPKILLVGLEQFGTARLSRELQAAGFLVGIACRSNAFLARTNFFDERFLFGRHNHGRGLLAAIRSVVSAWKPDWVVPMDDRTALFLAQVCHWGQTHPLDEPLAKLLGRSLGHAAVLPEVADKWKATQAAGLSGVRTPPARLVNGLTDVSDFVAQHGFPVVLKRCFSHGGKDVHVCHDPGQLQKSFAHLTQRGVFYLRLLNWREKVRGRILCRNWLPTTRAVMISKFISGRPAMLQAVAFEGQMLGALPAIAEKTFPHAVSPASVVRFTRHEEMQRTAATLLARWKLSGFVAFDYIVDETGQAWFLECNPRPIPIAHLGALAGEDLCRRFYSRLIGGPMPEEKPFTEMAVAHFPKEQRRDPQSPWLQNAFHDVPKDDPELMTALLEEPIPSAND